jgi:NTP pyrophosphatase (non-canonical NTP hydrolase)
MPDEQKLAVLVEEVGEVARELCESRAESRSPDSNLKTELIQLAAVAVAWSESL